jgi:chromosome segregation ATPase
MTYNEDIVFDENSGVSQEEQEEILNAINGITEKNRLSLSADTASQGDVVKAKKSGALFPLVVNIAALAVLCAGAFLIISFNRKTDNLAKTGNAVYNLTEKALIEEIRKDTEQKIAVKDTEISKIASRLEEVDAQLAQLQSSAQELTEEQLAAQEKLIALQTSYREELSVLQDERSQILEDSRLKEARLRSQLEERTRELAAVRQTTSEELERLTNEQKIIAAIDAQLAGGLASVSELVNEGEYDKAAHVVESLRDFCSNNSMSFVRSYQAKKEIYSRTIDSMDTVIEEMRKFRSINAEGLELFEKNVKLEEAVAEMQKTIDAFSSGSTNQTRRLKELEDSVTTLRASVSSLELSSSEKDRTISSLENDKSQLNRTVADLQSVNTARDQEIARLRSQLDTIRQVSSQE